MFPLPPALQYLPFPSEGGTAQNDDDDNDDEEAKFRGCQLKFFSVFCDADANDDREEGEEAKAGSRRSVGPRTSAGGMAVGNIFRCVDGEEIHLDQMFRLLCIWSSTKVES